MYCEYEIFKMITEYEIRDCIRNHNNKYLVFINFVNDNYTIFQNPAYKTFMIDADNRIKWVGNPLESHKTLTLFINSIK